MSTYRKPTPYAKAQTYRGAEVRPAVAVPSEIRACAGAWADAAPGSALAAMRWAQSEPADRSLVAPLRDATPRDRSAALPFAVMAKHDQSLRAPFADGEGVQHMVTAPFGVQTPHDRFALAPWGTLSPFARIATLRHRHARAHDRQLRAAWAELRAASTSRSSFWRALVARGAYVALPWSPMHARTASVRIDWPVEPPPTTGPIVIPEKAVYVMIPTLSARRVSDDVQLPLLNASIECDGGWAWTLTGALPYAARALIDPIANDGPVDIEITVNGFVGRFVVEGFDDNRRFGSNTLSLRARSRSALLASPYSAARTWTQAAPRTAAQLAADELVDSGWTVLWDAPDWLLPAGTFSYQDLAPLEAIGQLAASIGAMVHADFHDTTLKVSPRYPVSPWEWADASPFAVIPASIITAGDSSWQGGTNADGIYVYPEGGGTGAFVKITGTDGANALPMVVDRLLVTADAQRERGRAEIASAGRKRTATRTIPLLPPLPNPEGSDLGIVPIGALVEFHEADETWRGQVTSVRIDAQRNGDALSVRQHLSIERQYR